MGNDAVAKEGLSGMGDRPFVGRSVTRLEDPPLVTGRGRFAADISFAHQLHMRLVRSTHAHGRIVAIDTSAALATMTQTGLSAFFAAAMILTTAIFLLLSTPGLTTASHI